MIERALAFKVTIASEWVALVGRWQHHSLLGKVQEVFGNHKSPLVPLGLLISSRPDPTWT